MIRFQVRTAEYVIRLHRYVHESWICPGGRARAWSLGRAGTASPCSGNRRGHPGTQAARRPADISSGRSMNAARRPAPSSRSTVFNTGMLPGARRARAPIRAPPPAANRWESYREPPDFTGVRAIFSGRSRIAGTTAAGRPRGRSWHPLPRRQRAADREGPARLHLEHLLLDRDGHRVDRDHRLVTSDRSLSIHPAAPMSLMTDQF
jgi:hypothetical protein